MPSVKREQFIQQQEQTYVLPFEDGRLQQQDDFYSECQYRFRVMSGGVGSGKSIGLVKAIYYLLTVIPGNRGLLARWDGKELRQTTMTELWNAIPQWMIEKKNDQAGYLRLKAKYGGSELLYGDLKETRAIQNYNLGFFAVDQMEEIDTDRWNLLVGRLRKKTPFLDPYTHEPIKNADGEIVYAPTYGLGVCNPDAFSHFIYKYFSDDSPEKKPDYKLYHVTTYDGLAAKFVTDEYVKSMEDLYPPAMRSRLLLGEWGAFQGRIYPMFDIETHVVDYIFIKRHWKLYETIDHGIQNPTAVGWYAVDESGNVFLLDEHYEGNGRSVSYHAQIIKAKRATLMEKIPGTPITYLDAHCWAKDQVNGPHVYSIADEYNTHGIYPIPGQKDKKAGINRVIEHLAIDPNRLHPITGTLGAPRLYVASHCTHFIDEMLGYRWKKSRGLVLRNEPDMPIDYNDHHMDALSYFLLTRPQQPVIQIEPRLSPLDLWQQQRKSYNPLANEPVTAGSWMGV